MSPRGIVTFICRSSVRRPGVWFGTTLLITLLSLFGVARLGLDTDLIRLLPKSSRAAQATRELGPIVGGGGYFAVIFEGDDKDVLEAAVKVAAERIRALEKVLSAEYENPVRFFDKYRFLLIPSYYLDKIFGLILEWQAEVNPFIDDFEEEDDGESYGEREDRKNIEEQLRHFSSLPPYHQSSDGRLMGILVRPRQGMTSLGSTRELFGELESVASAVGDKYGVGTGVSGSMRNKVDEYDLIVSDLGRSGIIASTAIVLTLLLSFGSLRLLPVLLFPLAAGMSWSVALVPILVGDLNTITAFLLVVLFGMGIDYSIHLVKRFQFELDLKAKETGSDALSGAVGNALTETYLSTGIAVGASGLTTALALGVLSVSDFRGFSEFGIVGAVSVMLILSAMFTVMPAVLVLAARSGWTGRRKPVSSFWVMPGRVTTVVSIALLIFALVVSVFRLRFDYDFSALKASVPAAREIKEKQKKVYRTSGSPAALYVARDLETLDKALDVLRVRKSREGTTLGRIRSIRDFVPSEGNAPERLGKIEEIREETGGGWTRRIEDQERRHWIDEFNKWKPPSARPVVEDVPSVVSSALISHDGKGQMILGVFPNVERSHGLNAMAFTEELYGLEMPEGIRGPMGETPVFAEILWLVTQEGPWLIALTFIGVIILVFSCQRSLADTMWILLPLVSGVVLTFGCISLVGIKLNFFSMVVIPALLGLGVDDGVHYYRRWKELGGDTRSAQKELFGPLTVTSATTMMGYSGMVFASHAGLYSIGQLACIGLGLVWFTSLFLLPGLLSLKGRWSR